MTDENDMDEFKKQPLVLFLDRFVEKGRRDATLDDVMIDALAKLIMTTFDELVKTSGKVEALAAVKPYRKEEMQYAITGIKKGMNIQSDGVDALLLTYLLAGATFISIDKMKGEIKERGGVGTFQDCVCKDGSPELCMSISHYCTGYLTEFINPEYECIWTHHQSSGDPLCRFVFKKKSDPITVLDDLGSTLMTLPKFELGKDQLQAQSIWGMSGFLRDNTCAFVDLHGSEKALEVLCPNAYKIGQEIGQRLVGQHAKVEANAESLGELVRGMQKTTGQRSNYSIISNDMVENEITDCLLILGARYEWCKQREALFHGIVNAINPEYEFVYDSMKTKGDANCHWVIRKKVNDKSARPQESSQDDSLGY